MTNREAIFNLIIARRKFERDYEELKWNFDATPFDMAIEALSDVPDTNVGKWIPVSEQLPGKGEEVLVTNYWHEVRMAYLTDRTRGKVLCWVVDHNSYHPVDKNELLAWMPLPTPFFDPTREEGEKDE